MYIKICGLTSVEAVTAAAEAGATAVGFVFAKSPRRVTPEQAVELTRDLPHGIARVAVMLHPSPQEWNAVRDVFAPDWLQTDAEDFAALEVPDTVGCLPVYRDSEDFDPTNQSIQLPQHMLFEGAKSGVGMQPDWERAAQVAHRTCMMLAGGLNPDNIAEAIVQVHPWAVDVSSGVESAPGVKDPERFRAFVAAARAASER